MSQLSLLDFFDEEKVVIKANKLIDMLNDGRAKKELYYGQYYFPHNGYWVFMASNDKRELLFNVVDNEGNIPVGLPANWRHLAHVKQEISL